MTQQTMKNVIALWRDDWKRIKAGTYVAPLPHPSRIVFTPKLVAVVMPPCDTEA